MEAFISTARIYQTKRMCDFNAKLKDRLNKFRKTDEDVRLSLETYDDAAYKLCRIHETRKGCKGSKKLLHMILQQFRGFLFSSSIPYEHEIAIAWAVAHKPDYSRSHYKTCRHVILCLNEIITTGKLETRMFSSRVPKYQLEGWQSDLLAQYMEYRIQESCAKSTQRTIKSACSRFFSFLNREGINGLQDITPEILNKYNLQNTHSSVSGKNLYASQLRLFFRFLGEKGLVPITLELAVNYGFAPNTKIVRVLSDEQINAIYDYRNNAESPLDLRDSAIILLGLRMGLRKSDISNLKFGDILWKERAISISQQKTGVALKLPMPVDVGNSLFRYIQDGRPVLAECEYIFVRHNAPYCKMNGDSTGNRSLVAIKRHSGIEINGFHITRKTFASNLLKTGNPIPVIASALGHVSFMNVDQYLSTDNENLKKCAIGLSGIEYMGRYSL